MSAFAEPDAGFTDIALFYAGFPFRGWVAYAPCSGLLFV
jgi:hypothetical protein